MSDSYKRHTFPCFQAEKWRNNGNFKGTSDLWFQLLRVRVPSATLQISLKLTTFGWFCKKPLIFFPPLICHFLSIFFTFCHYFSYKLHTVHLFGFVVTAEIEKCRAGENLGLFIEWLETDSFDLQCRVH
jgi:hypothetical protein